MGISDGAGGCRVWVFTSQKFLLGPFFFSLPPLFLLFSLRDLCATEGGVSGYGARDGVDMLASQIPG